MPKWSTHFWISDFCAKTFEIFVKNTQKTLKFCILVMFIGLWFHIKYALNKQAKATFSLKLWSLGCHKRIKFFFLCVLFANDFWNENILNDWTVIWCLSLKKSFIGYVQASKWRPLVCRIFSSKWQYLYSNFHVEIHFSFRQSNFVHIEIPKMHSVFVFAFVSFVALSHFNRTILTF